MSKDTVCQTCVFATNNDCKIGLIENAKQAGLEVLECWNENGEFNVIKNRKCIYHRPKAWAFGKSKNKLYQLASKELEMKFTAYVVCDKSSSFNDVKITLDSLDKQKLKPDCVIVIKEVDCTVDKLEILNYLKTKSFNEWKIEGIVDPERIGRYAIELAIRWKPRPFLACFRAGRKLHKHFLFNINNKITKHFFQFGIINNDKDDVDGVIVPNIILKYFKNQLYCLEELLERDMETCSGIIDIKTIDPKFQ